MICTDCRQAGVMNEKGRWFAEQNRMRDAESMFEIAEALHEECKGCPCHHDTRRAHA